MNSQSPQLLVVGSVAIDWIITPRAERKESVGGSATFFAMAASYLAQVAAAQAITAEILLTARGSSQRYRRFHQ